MKKITTFLICYISLMTLFLFSDKNCSCASQTLEPQYNLIYDNFNIWDISDYKMSSAYYAIADLDGNNRLEVICAMNYSTGGHTHLEVYEVNKTGTGLNPLGNGIDFSSYSLNDSDISVETDGYIWPKDESVKYFEDYYSPDILISDSMEIPFYSNNQGMREFILNDYYSCGHDYSESIIETLCLYKGRLSVRPIMTYVFDRFADEQEICYNQSVKTGERIAKTDYDNWESLFKGYTRGTAVLKRFNDISKENIKKSYETFAESVSLYG